jgi:hypothetical protein
LVGLADLLPFSDAAVEPADSDYAGLDDCAVFQE